MEPLIDSSSVLANKFVLNTRRQDLNTFYQQHKASFWTPQEIDFEKDRKDWATLLPNEQFFLKQILAFFAASDGIVNDNLAQNFYSLVSIPEARAFYAFQMAMETIHSETYWLLIETYITQPQEQEEMLRAVDTNPIVSKKAQWALRWTNPNVATLAERLVAFIAVEGIFFSGSFCAIFWLKKRNVLPGLMLSNEFIARDEGLHCEFAIHLYNHYIKYKLSPQKIEAILLSALDIEREFMVEALPVELIGMNSSLMITYLEYVTDRLLSQLYCPKKFHSKNPFDFMTMISLEGKTNFFEKRVSEYQRAHVLFPSKLTFDASF